MIVYTPADFTLPQILETAAFSDTITLTIPAPDPTEVPPPPAPPTIVKIAVTADREDVGVTVQTSFSSSSGTVTIGGKYSSVFPNRIVVSVARGSSDLLEEPRVDKEYVPMQGRDVISVTPDPRQSITVTYTVSTTLSNGTTETQAFTKIVEQDYTSTADYIKRSTQ